MVGNHKFWTGASIRVFGLCVHEQMSQRRERGVKCQFSHDPEDIRKWKALKELGQEGAKSLVKSLGNKSAGSSYKKTHSDLTPQPPTQGARPQGQRPGVGRRS